MCGQGLTIVMDDSADVAAMAIVVQQEEEEAANRGRVNSPPPYQQAVEEEEDLDVAVYPKLWDQLDRLEEHWQSFNEASYSTRFLKMCLYGNNFKGFESPSYSNNLKRACFAGWVLLKDSIFPLVSNRLAVFVWSLGHFISVLSILLTAIFYGTSYPITVIILFCMAIAPDLLYILVRECTQRDHMVERAPLIRDRVPPVLVGTGWMKRYSSLLRILIAELVLFILLMTGLMDSNIIGYNNTTCISNFYGNSTHFTMFSVATSVSFLLFVVITQLTVTVKVCVTITKELTKSKRSQAREYTLKAFGWFSCQLICMKCLEIVSLLTLGGSVFPFFFGPLMYCVSVLSVLGYLLVLHESLEYLGISRLVDFLIALSRLQAMPRLAKRRKEKIQHILQCFDYPICVREFVTVQKERKLSLTHLTYVPRNPVLAIGAIFISFAIVFGMYIFTGFACSPIPLPVVIIVFIILNSSMLKNALQSILFFVLVLTPLS